MLLLFCLTLGASGFWEQKAPEDWTIDEVRSILELSPWSRALRNRGEPLFVHLGSALPMRQAESRERAFQKRMGAPSASFDEYQGMLNEGIYTVLCVKINDREAFSDGDLVNRMQKDTQMRTDGKTYKLVTHFPPSASDPYLRLVFPRISPPGKSIEFTFVVPGAMDPYRQVSFFTKDMNYRGKLEY
jgi:hypothetical protein